MKFNPAGREALSRSADLARQHQAALYVAHILDYRLHSADTSQKDIARAVEQAQERFVTEAGSLTEGLTVTFKSEPGDPAMSVCRLARDCQADLIVLGCHQLSQKLSLGRIDYVGITILEKAPCPVLLVPHEY
jgi:nucleotide-binding universal stress UspA family protein